MGEPGWSLSEDERRVLGAALDALLPPEGSFPLPSQTDMIEAFVLRRIPAPGAGTIPYPGIDGDGLRAILARLASGGEMTGALECLEHESPDEFLALWRLAVYGYYSRPETIAAIQRDLAPAYHGAPLPLGYAHAIAPWDPADPFQRPQRPRGGYIPTEAVARVDLSGLSFEEERR